MCPTFIRRCAMRGIVSMNIYVRLGCSGDYAHAWRDGPLYRAAFGILQQLDGLIA